MDKAIKAKRGRKPQVRMSAEDFARALRPFFLRSRFCETAEQDALQNVAITAWNKVNRGDLKATAEAVRREVRRCWAGARRNAERAVHGQDTDPETGRRRLRKVLSLDAPVGEGDSSPAHLDSLHAPTDSDPAVALARKTQGVAAPYGRWYANLEDQAEQYDKRSREYQEIKEFQRALGRLIGLNPENSKAENRKFMDEMRQATDAERREKQEKDNAKK